MRIAIIGNNDGPERLRVALEAAGHGVAFLGYQKESGASRSTAEGATVLTPDETTALAKLAGHDFDLLINCFANFRYRKLLATYRCWNVHLAPLPCYRGRHPLQWALINGETHFGATVHEMNADFDAGPILWQSRIEVVPGWSARQLREALLQTVETEIGAVVTRFAAGTLTPRPNPDDQGSYFPRRTPADSLLTPKEMYDHRRAWRKIRALRHDTHPARLLVDNREIIVLDAYVGRREAEPGEREFLWGDGVTLMVKPLVAPPI